MRTLFMRERATEKVKKWLKEVREDKTLRLNEVRKKNAGLSKEIAGYFQSKAKDRKYFY